MKMHSFSLLALLSLCLHEISAYRLLAVKRERYTADSQRKLSTDIWFGDASTGDGESWELFDKHFCWAPEINAGGYCFVYFKVTQKEGVEHYQIVGGETKQYDSTSRYLYNTITWGKTNEGEKLYAGDGEAWVGSGLDDWGYQYRYFYVNKTTEPSLTQAFGRQARSAGGNPTYKDKEITGDIKEAEEVHIDDFRAHTDDWGSDSIYALYLYTAKTVLKDMAPDWESKELLNSNAGTPSEALQERILINDNCGDSYEAGQTGVRTTETVITLTETVSWSSQFSFGFSIGYEAGFDVGVVSNKINVGLEFTYSLSQEFSSTKSIEQKETYVWPTRCEPGNKCKTTLYKTRNQYKVPVDFTFERNGEQFVKSNEMFTTIETFRDKIWKPEPTNTPCRRR